MNILSNANIIFFTNSEKTQTFFNTQMNFGDANIFFRMEIFFKLPKKLNRNNFSNFQTKFGNTNNFFTRTFSEPAEQNLKKRTFFKIANNFGNGTFFETPN